MVVSLYCVLWGKSEEHSTDNGGGLHEFQAERQRKEQLKDAEVSGNETPLFV